MATPEHNKYASIEQKNSFYFKKIQNSLFHLMIPLGMDEHAVVATFLR